MSPPVSESLQFLLLKDSFARRLLSFPELQWESSTNTEPELDDFSSYLAHEVWSTLPPAFLDASYETKARIPDDLDSVPLDSTPVSFTDTLISYGIASDIEASQVFLRKVVAAYLTEACAPPPVWSSTRTKECEICEREVPLTYHHLIPRSTHAKAAKKKWHPPSMLNSVAWLCRPCHTVVHHVATNEELAQHYFSVSLLLERDDIRRWGKYASKQRFGVRRG
ncbi:hypothetical protein DFH08DRAFT_839759 [Mycena albidolilacea]|uniref:HNH domain-containing protein n=1 Tax=Mycena albidolilacea TaxID=1033008 RepID=A0AAD7APT9_9AGAR|nr:hypothetical protein DFH08DRAFT_839759 [Mycena albidolilacea]